MPAIMDDPAAPTIHRVSGAPPYPDPDAPALPPDIRPRQVTLRDRQTIATVVPFVRADQVPPSLLRYLCDQFAKEIEGGDTYPMITPMPFDKFSAYWLQNFAGIMLLGRIDGPDEVVEGKDWSVECLGSFYIKPNYPGRSSHVCNAGFLVTDAARNRGVGRLMGETYLDWAPRLGYTYSVFNLVYETNVASCRIWDALGFKRIGRVRGCGNLKSYPDRLVDAIIYGRDLGTAADDASGEGAGEPQLVSEERFDKIKFYLKHGRYPNGSDRAEKNRLRSSATHYKLAENDVLMLKGKEVISDPVRQTAIARRVHEEGGHAGINKTTSVIAEKFHWSRIKEMVAEVIRTCEQCKDLGKSPSVQGKGQGQSQSQNQNQNRNGSDSRSQIQNHNPSVTQIQAFCDVPRRFNDVNERRDYLDSAPDLMAPQPPPIQGPHDAERASRILDLPPHHSIDGASHHHGVVAPHLVTNSNPYAHPADISSLLNPPFEQPPGHHLMLHGGPHHHASAAGGPLHDADIYHPIDPQIISQGVVRSSPHHHHHQQQQQQYHDAYQGFHAHHDHHDQQHHDGYRERLPPHRHPASPLPLEYGPHAPDADVDSFHTLLHDPDDGSSSGHHQPHDGAAQHRDDDAVDRDMAMLIEHPSPSSPSSPSFPSAAASSPENGKPTGVESRAASPLRCEMDIDDLVLPKDDVAPYRDRGKERERDDAAGGGGPASGTSKRSDIYDVVFHASGEGEGDEEGGDDLGSTYR
ncbi:hypothetical protein F4802DRAFT_471752 [Xylaria palmicola]|nr:hypothetical protein F4802DRAFT_471752 [Xylaria palmicola]